MTSLNTYLRSERRDPAGGLNGVVTHQLINDDNKPLGLLGVFRSFDRANQPWGSPRLSGRASLTAGLGSWRGKFSRGEFLFDSNLM